MGTVLGLAVSDSLWPHELWSARLLCPWNSPGKNTDMGCHALIQGIFPTQGSNPSLPHCKQILYHLSHWGSPRILEWVAYPFSRGFSQPRNTTGISCISGGFLTAELQGETRVQSLVWEDPLEKGMATHSSILAWRIPWTEESAGCRPQDQKKSDTTEWLTF